MNLEMVDLRDQMDSKWIKIAKWQNAVDYIQNILNRKSFRFKLAPELLGRRFGGYFGPEVIAFEVIVFEVVVGIIPLQ